MPLLKVESLNYDVRLNNSNESLRLLEGISFEVNNSEMIAIIGPSGSGKSTLLKLLRGLLRPNSTSIYWKDEDCIQSIQNQIGYAPQFETLHSELSVLETCSFSLQLQNPTLSTNEVEEKVNKTLQEMRLDTLANTQVGDSLSLNNSGLSGGQRKRVSVSLEFIKNVELLLLDEPLTSLAPSDSQLVVDVLQEISETCAVVIVSHELSEHLLQKLDKIILLNEVGQIDFQGKPADLFEHFDQRYEEQNGPELSIKLSQQERYWNQLKWLNTQSNLQRKIIEFHHTSRGSLLEHLFEYMNNYTFKMLHVSDHFKIVSHRDLIRFFRNPTNIGDHVKIPLSLGILGALVLQGDAKLLMGFFAFVSFLLGALPASIAINSERNILEREVKFGLNVTSYLASKVVTLNLSGVVRCLVLCVVLLTTSQVPLMNTPVNTSHVFLFVPLFASHLFGSVVGLLISSVFDQEKDSSYALVFVLGIVLLLSGILAPPSCDFNTSLYLFNINPLRWNYGSLMVSNHTDNLAGLGFGYDGFILNTMKSLCICLIIFIATDITLKQRKLK